MSRPMHDIAAEILATANRLRTLTDEARKTLRACPVEAIASTALETIEVLAEAEETTAHAIVGLVAHTNDLAADLRSEFGALDGAVSRDRAKSRAESARLAGVES